MALIHRHLLVGLGEGEEGAGVALGDAALVEAFLDLRRELKEAEGVGDGGAGLADLVGDGVLGEAELVHEAAVGAGGLHRVDVLALDVLDHRELERALVGGGADDDGDGLEARELGGPQSAFSGDEFVPALA